jgi:hypothetical protein
VSPVSDDVTSSLEPGEHKHIATGTGHAEFGYLLHLNTKSINFKCRLLGTTICLIHMASTCARTIKQIDELMTAAELAAATYRCLNNTL